MRATIGGTNQSTTGNGTASSSTLDSTYSYPASYAFDSNTTTTCALSGVNGTWYKWDFGAGNDKDVGQLAINTSAGANGWSVNTFIKTARLEYSDDNSTWTTWITTTQLPQAEGTYTFNGPIVTVVNSATTLPRLGVSAVGGSYSFNTLPALSASASGAGRAGISLPRLRAVATARSSLKGDCALDVTLPSLSVDVQTGSNAAALLPELGVQASGTGTLMAQAAANLPRLSASATGTVAATGDADITLPSMSGSSYAGALCSITLGGITTQAKVTVGGVGGAKITLPLFEATAIATAQNRGSAAIVLPSLQMGATVRAALILPSLQLTAIGTAVVTATYEAYAVNLKHSDPNANDEATRYTNYPFTHVVRYQGSYYGANSTGLYLLEGTTDAGTAIPWEVKTAITDFKSPMKKVPEAAYFSGRFGPNSTIRLHVGEKTPITYAFSTPRGQLAQNHRAKFGKGKECQSRYYALSASGTGEADIDGIEPVFHNTTRRI